jgi:hypothetical protein
MLRTYLLGLRQEDKALLKILADAGVALQQRTIMQELPFLRGKNSASLRSLKSHVNAGCRESNFLRQSFNGPVAVQSSLRTQVDFLDTDSRPEWAINTGKAYQCFARPMARRPVYYF